MKLAVQGWYRDPYAIHEDRYFSEGSPTKLVRDGGQESYDPPPDRPRPEGELVPAESSSDSRTRGQDLRRADEACAGPPFDPAKGVRAVWDVFDQTSGNGGI
jgi:hypothetical protein